MAEEARHSDEVQVGSGSSSVQTIIESRDDAPLRIHDLVVDYDDAATTATTVEIHESPDGTGSGSLDSSTRRKTMYLTAGERRALTGIKLRDVQSDLLVLPDGNQDAGYAVYADGEHVLSTRD